MLGIGRLRSFYLVSLTSSAIRLCFRLLFFCTIIVVLPSVSNTIPSNDLSHYIISPELDANVVLATTEGPTAFVNLTLVAGWL
jgi:hypothetical protein